MFEKVESEGIIIEWDHPKPAKVIPFSKKSNVWYKRLKPMMKFPGRQARIARGLDTTKKATGLKSTIMRSLRNSDPYEHWTTRTAKDDDGTFGVWVTYDGRMNEAEYMEYEKARLERYDKMMRQRLHNKLVRQQEVGRSTLAASLRPPVVTED